MLGRKLYTLLENFSQKEQNDFKKYFDCAYFTSKTERKLMAVILSFHPHYLQTNIDSEVLYEQVFPESDFNYKKLKDLFADLAHQVELFIAIDYLKKNRFQQKKLLALAYHQKTDFHNFSKATNTALKNLKKSPVLYDSYEHLSITNYQHYFLHEKKGTTRSNTLKINNQLLNQSFTLNQLRFYGESFANKMVYSNQGINRLPFYEMVMKMAEELSLKNKLINLYFQIVRLWEKGSENQFLIADSTFRSLQPSLDLPESTIAFNLLTNFTIARYGQRDDSYLIHQFNLYKLGINTQLFIISTTFSYATFLNIIATSFALKQIDFIQTFTVDTLPLLPPDNRADSEKLASAYYHFGKENYVEAGKIAAFLQRTPLVIAIRAYLIGLRSSFEDYVKKPEEFKFFLITCAKFERYIKSRKRLAPTKKEAYLAHLYLLKELANNIKEKSNRKNKLQLFQQKIDNTTNLIGWQYLKNRAAALL